MKSILVTGLLFSLAISTIHATGQDRGREEKAAPQGAASSTNDQIEVKTDRFSNATTVTLKPQAIIDKPAHLITMEIKTKLEKKSADDVFRDSVEAYVVFESHSNDGVDFGDGEIHLLVDGRPLRIPPGELELQPLLDPKPGFRTYKSGGTLFDREDLEQIKRASRIEMRLGSIELTLSTTTLAMLREYAIRVLAQQKNINGR